MEADIFADINRLKWRQDHRTCLASHVSFATLIHSYSNQVSTVRPRSIPTQSRILYTTLISTNQGCHPFSASFIPIRRQSHVAPEVPIHSWSYLIGHYSIHSFISYQMSSYSIHPFLIQSYQKPLASIHSLSSHISPSGSIDSLSSRIHLHHPFILFKSQVSFTIH